MSEARTNPDQSTYCRLGECMAGLIATVVAGRITALVLDEEHPMGRHGACPICLGSMGAASDPRRILRPRKRTAAGYEEIPWEQALTEIAGRMKDIRRQSGPRALALYAGGPVGTNSMGLARTLAFSLGVGTPNLFSPLSVMGGPWLRATELVLGHPAALQSDVGRAHYVLLLGSNQDAQGWGPLQAGRNIPVDLAFSRKTKGTKVAVADARTTAIAAAADVHVAIRPGTELFLLLGMIDQIVKNEWFEKQYVDDWCTPLAALKDALAPWPIERCAQVCGVEPGEIGGVALKFSRAAMAVVHRSPQALASRYGTLTAWAILVVHALTANLLRPGGLYDNKGVLDAHPLAAALPTTGAPRTRIGDFPLLLLQAPGAVLADEILSPGEGQVRAVVSIHGNPARDLPGGARLAEALDGLDLLVAIDVAENETTRAAHYVLPGTHAWERADLHLHDTSILPLRMTQWTDALVQPPGEARDETDILAELFRKLGPSYRGGVHGAHLRVLGALVATADLPAWEERLLDLTGKITLTEVKEAPHAWQGGEVDRATWRITTASGKIELLPVPIAEALAQLDPTPDAGFDSVLLTSAARDSALRAFDRPVADDPGVTLHPDAGFAEGQRVRVVTGAGSVESIAHLDATLRRDTVDFPSGYAADVLALVPTDILDPLTGTPACNGLACRVEAV